jgi:YD repeat-containing protein
MKTKIIITLLCFGISLNILGQNRYEEFKEQFSESIRQRNKSFLCIKTYQQKTGDKKRLSNIIYFNNDGLPSSIQEVDDTIEVNRNDFSYESGKLFCIEEFHKNEKFLTAELDYTDDGSIRSVTESVFSSLTKEKLPAHTYNYRYYPNGQLKQIYVFEGIKRDTVEIRNFDNRGHQITSYMNYGGLATKRIEFIWSKDSTECKEIHYGDNNKAYNTIVSKFMNKRLIQKIDKSTSPTPFYWKYDKFGRVVETNSGVFYTQRYFYDENGLLVKQTMTVVEEFNYNNFPKTIEATYEYVQR